MYQDRLLRDDRRWTILAVTLLTFGIIWTFASRSPAAATRGGAPPPSPREGFSAPDFTLELLGGEQTSPEQSVHSRKGRRITLSDLRGKVVLVNFWATWCPPCRAEMPAIEKVYRSFKPLGLEVLAVNLADQDGQAAVSGFIQELGLTFPIPLDLDGSVNARYTLRGLPSSFFIDRQGVIRSVVVGGPMSEALIQSKIEKLLKEKE
jgi:thiol-disulfide isomerase/thioredoxin